MGKNKKKKNAKKAWKGFLKSNQVLLAALGGAAAGITLATTLGSDKAKALIQSVENSVATVSDKIKHGLNSNGVHEEKPAAVS